MFVVDVWTERSPSTSSTSRRQAARRRHRVERRPRRAARNGPGRRLLAPALHQQRPARARRDSCDSLSASRLTTTCPTWHGVITGRVAANSGTGESHEDAVEGRMAIGAAVRSRDRRGIAGGVVAATQLERRSRAQRLARQKADRGIERRVDRLLARMTLDEKLQQVQLLSDGQITDADARRGVGSVFSLVDPARIDSCRRSRSRSRGSASRSCSRTTPSTAIGRSSRSRSARPAASIPNVAAERPQYGARESAAVGLKQIYSPMVDVSHEARDGAASPRRAARTRT